MIKYTEIDQFRNAIRNVKHDNDYKGMNNDNQPIFKHDQPYPILKFRGTVKLQGTNSGIIYYKNMLDNEYSKVLKGNADIDTDFQLTAQQIKEAGNDPEKLKEFGLKPNYTTEDYQNSIALQVQNKYMNPDRALNIADTLIGDHTEALELQLLGENKHLPRLDNGLVDKDSDEYKEMQSEIATDITHLVGNQTTDKIDKLRRNLPSSRGGGSGKSKIIEVPLKTNQEKNFNIDFGAGVTKKVSVIADKEKDLSEETTGVKPLNIEADISKYAFNPKTGKLHKGIVGKQVVDINSVVHGNNPVTGESGYWMDVTGKIGGEEMEAYIPYEGTAKADVESHYNMSDLYDNGQQQNNSYTNSKTVKDSNGNTITIGVKEGKWYNTQTGKEIK